MRRIGMPPLFAISESSLVVSFLLLLLLPRDASSLDPSDFLVEGLGDIVPAFREFNGTMYSGLLPIDNDIDGTGNNLSSSRGELSFWLLTPNESKDSLTVWLNGGPGCSSFGVGLLMECGPVTTPHHAAGHGNIPADEPLLPNKYSWTKATNLLFVEQPTGVGFSHGSKVVQSEADVSQDFYNFLLRFFSTFPTMQEKSLYIVGESYAGMFVPSIAHYIHTQNKKKESTNINLSGIALGNGWIDAMTQGPAVIDYGYWHGLIDSTTRDTLWKVWKRCEQKLPMKEPFHDFTTTDECNILGSLLDAAGASAFPAKDHYAPNSYDVTTWDSYPILYAPMNSWTSFLNDPKVLEKLHFENIQTQWRECIPGAGRRRRLGDDKVLLPGQTLLAHDTPESVAPYIAELLDDAGIRVLVYAGDRDISVNLQGSERVLNDIAWSGKNDWKHNADRFLWIVNGTVAGYVKTHKNLDMLSVRNSGHLVPYNVPAPALDLIQRLVNGRSFGDVILPKIQASDEEKYFVPDANDNGNTRYHWLTIVATALLCFVVGVLVGSPQKNSPYQKIPDASIVE